MKLLILVLVVWSAICFASTEKKEPCEGDKCAYDYEETERDMLPSNGESVETREMTEGDDIVKIEDIKVNVDNSLHFTYFEKDFYIEKEKAQFVGAFIKDALEKIEEYEENEQVVPLDTLSLPRKDGEEVDVAKERIKAAVGVRLGEVFAFLNQLTKEEHKLIETQWEGRFLKKPHTKSARFEDAFVEEFQKDLGTDVMDKFKVFKCEKTEDWTNLMNICNFLDVKPCLQYASMKVAEVMQDALSKIQK